jgi:hypothetical protein
MKVLETNLKSFKYCVNLPMKILIQTQRITLHSILFFYKTLFDLFLFLRDFVRFINHLELDQIPTRSLHFFHFMTNANCEKALSILNLLNYYFDFSLLKDKKRQKDNYIFILKKQVSLEVDILRLSYTKIYENIIKVFEIYKQRLKEIGKRI